MYGICMDMYGNPVKKFGASHPTFQGHSKSSKPDTDLLATYDFQLVKPSNNEPSCTISEIHSNFS